MTFRRHDIEIICAVSIFFAAERDSFAAESNTHMSVGIRQPLLTLSVDDDGSDPNSRSYHEIVFEPKIPTIGVLSASYGNLSAGYSHNLDGENEDDLSYTDYKLQLFYTQFGIDLAYTEFERFRINDSTGFPASLSEKDARKPDMAARLITANLYYFPVAWRYGLEQALEPNEKKKTGLGLGFIGSYSQFEIDAPGGLVPQQWRMAFGPDGAFESGILSSVNMQLAAGLTIAPGPLYVSFLGAFGPGHQAFTYETETTERTGVGETDKLTVRVGVGYSADRTFAGLQYQSESPRYLLKDMALTADSTDISALFGVKF